MRIKNLFIALFLVSAACTSSGDKATSAQQQVAAPSADDMAVHTVTSPEMPDSLDRPSQRIDYLMTHYWVNLDFANRRYMSDTLMVEQAFANFIEMLPRVSSPDVAVEAIANLYKRASVSEAAFLQMVDVADKYLYTEDSPMRNRRLYAYFIEAILPYQMLPQSTRDLLLRQQSTLED